VICPHCGKSSDAPWENVPWWKYDSGRAPTVGLGCGTLLLIGIIVSIFSPGRDLDQQVRGLRSEVADVKQASRRRSGSWRTGSLRRPRRTTPRASKARRTSLCSRKGGHYGLPRFVVYPDRPAAELCRTVACNPATRRRIDAIRPPKSRTPGIKSSNGVQSPRLFSETIASASTSKGYLISGMEVAASRSCSNSEARGSAVPAESTQLPPPLHVGQFKSRRQFRRTFSRPVHSRFATASLD
jgi:hypothetical protein